MDKSKYKIALVLKFIIGSLIWFVVVLGCIRNAVLAVLVCIVEALLAWDILNIVVVATIPQVRYTKNRQMQRLVKHYIKKYNLE